MPPSQKEINIFEALRELSTRVLRGDFGRGDNFDEAEYAYVYGQLRLPIIFPVESDGPQQEDRDDVKALDEALATEKETDELSQDVLDKIKDFPPVPEGVEDAEEESASDSKETETDDERWPCDISITPATGTTEAEGTNATEVDSPGEDLLSEKVDRRE